MKGKRIAGMVLAFALCLALAACGSQAAYPGGDKTASGEMNNATMAPSSPAASENWGFDAAPDVDDWTWNDAPGTGMEAGGGAGSVYQNSNAKLIRRASLSVQTTEFNHAVRQLRDLVDRLGGYFQHSQTYGGGYYDRDARRSAYFTIRVPAEQYDTFLSHTGELGYVTNRDESTENVGELYFDLEARLTTQRTKQERLLELLSRAEKMEDILLLENALSEVEYQIEQYSSSLNRYDGLIGFATIELNLNEVIRIVEEPGQTDSLLQRMAAGVASSAEGLVEGFQNLLIGLSYHLFAILIFAVLVVVLVVVLKRKKVFSRLRKKEPTDQI